MHPFLGLHYARPKCKERFVSTFITQRILHFRPRSDNINEFTLGHPRLTCKRDGRAGLMETTSVRGFGDPISCSCSCSSTDCPFRHPQTQQDTRVAATKATVATITVAHTLGSLLLLLPTAVPPVCPTKESIEKVARRGTSDERKRHYQNVFWGAVAKTRYTLLEYGQSKVQGRTEYN